MHSQKDYLGTVKNELLGRFKKGKGFLNIFVPILAPPPLVTNVKISFSDREDLKKNDILCISSKMKINRFMSFLSLN